ncbi:MAG TPA: low molecular weight protein arginine phosphatase [Chloroflexi bacterium]|nr:low molecular weight protein arginine phosphatase [Chloroflexota bacterium]
MRRILFVCTGNICRSPMAEVLLRAKFERDKARRDWQVASAGTWTVDGRSASEHAIAEMVQRGLDLGDHRSRNVTRDMMAQADLVLVMTRNHVEALESAFPDQAHKVHLLSEVTGGSGDVEDPYGGSRQDYAQVARELERFLDEGYERIVGLAAKDPCEGP